VVWRVLEKHVYWLGEGRVVKARATRQRRAQYYPIEVAALSQMPVEKQGHLIVVDSAGTTLLLGAGSWRHSVYNDLKTSQVD
jgi:hypothetical protein